MIFGQTVVDIEKDVVHRRWNVYSTTLTPRRLLCSVPWSWAGRDIDWAVRDQWPDFTRAVDACLSHPDIALTQDEVRASRGEPVNLNAHGQDEDATMVLSDNAGSFLRNFFDEQAEAFRTPPTLYVAPVVGVVFAVDPQQRATVRVLTPYFNDILHYLNTRRPAAARPGHARVYLAADGTPLPSGATPYVPPTLTTHVVKTLLGYVFGEDAAVFCVREI